MHFLPDVYVTCEVCKGKRYNDATLRVTYKGKSIAEVLETPRRRGAASCSSTTARSRGILQTLDDVGLGYIALGQPATTLSGGEAQRVKLARELAKRDTGRTLYLLDEPTTGLHFDDVQQAARGARPPGRRRQHRARHRAQPRRHQDRRLGHRPRPRGRRARRRGHRRRHARGGRARRRARTPASSSPRCSASAAAAPRPPRSASTSRRRRSATGAASADVAYGGPAPPGAARRT